MLIKCSLTITIFVLFVGCNADNQTPATNRSVTNGGTVSSVETPKNPENTRGGIFPETPDPHQCEADGNATYSVEGEEEPTQKTLPVEIWLLCPKNNAQTRTKEASSSENEFTKVVLPQAAGTVLDNHWRYLSGIKRETAISEIVYNRNDNIDALMKISIDAPNGKRPITRKEAEALLDFVEKVRKD